MPVLVIFQPKKMGFYVAHFMEAVQLSQIVHQLLFIYVATNWHECYLPVIKKIYIEIKILHLFTGKAIYVDQQSVK